MTCIMYFQLSQDLLKSLHSEVYMVHQARMYFNQWADMDYIDERYLVHAYLKCTRCMICGKGSQRFVKYACGHRFHLQCIKKRWKKLDTSCPIHGFVHENI
jgi:hypothetical protein